MPDKRLIAGSIRSNPDSIHRGANSRVVWTPPLMGAVLSNGSQQRRLHHRAYQVSHAAFEGGFETWFIRGPAGYLNNGVQLAIHQSVTLTYGFHPIKHAVG